MRQKNILIFHYLLGFFILVSLFLAVGCARRQVKIEPEQESYYPKASPDADKLIVVQSNKERTSFYVDGNFVVKGKRVEILVSDKPHTINAEPDGYVSKEEYIQPPYRKGYTVGFYYLIEDQVKTSTAAATPSAEKTVKIKIPPSIEIIYPIDQSKTKLSEVELKIRISGEGDIKKISIFVNGRESLLGEEELKRMEKGTDEPGGRGYRSLSQRVTLSEGRNVIQVQAQDQGNNLAQASVNLVREGKDTVQVKPLSVTTKVWLLAIGVSKYKDQSLNLQYADQDARTLYQLLTNPEKGMVKRESNSKLLLNEQATRVNMVVSLNNIFKQAFEEDFVILYFAMHGMVDPDGSELFFVTYDTDPRALVATGLSQLEIERAVSKSKAGKILMIVDTCHSGSAGLSGVFAQRSVSTAAESNRLLNRIAIVKKGMSIFTASSSTEFSQENQLWGGGHGVFTYYLLEGLKGQADENKDGFITLRELYDYTYRRVKEETKGNQHPEIKGTLDSNIPLAEIR